MHSNGPSNIGRNAAESPDPPFVPPSVLLPRRNAALNIVSILDMCQAAVAYHRQSAQQNFLKFVRPFIAFFAPSRSGADSKEEALCRHLPPGSVVVTATS